MAGTAYHNEALRKQRLIERKSEAMRNLKESFGQHSIEAGIEQSKPSNLVFSEAGHYAQNRFHNVEKSCQKNEVVFEEVVHDPNFKYRIAKESRDPPVHVDPIYQILYPGGVVTK
ncbi:uncharacterized protein LOC123565043 isoform X3 [Mercenaria mercenaria]|uniref:uncharacterized protein LOC123565043 isoform X3 n=1 Tax=Mercenaria mercenaria TaxID=6596 RepID=UPI00234E746A|nr:uncharacterized protein LOC123565043 isoform X3 [Mercenaria mercenaria]XP_053393620.1 uncharacterized protein LOC123565043 isoform X3 [Mercenaria mercenaria]